MRKLLLFFTVIMLSEAVYGQSYNERIAAAMNASDWFALDSIYKEAPRDSVMPFLDVFSRCLVGNRLNRPEESVQAFDELFANHGNELDLGNLLSSAMMFSMDLSRVGENRRAADLLSAIRESTQEYLDSAWTTAIGNYIGLYSALSGFQPYGISFDGSAGGKIPFRIVPVGPDDKNSVLMHLENCTINGIDADITFDTGAGVNVISDSLAREYGLIPLEASSKVAGLGIQTAGHAIAKELKVGNITLTDVPFSVLPITSGNDEADKYMDRFMIIVGSEMMLRMKDLTIDFINREITVAADAPARSQDSPNMCFSSGMNLLAKGSIHGNSMLMCLDTGDASYGSLSNKFFENNREYIVSHAELDTVRSAGFGGVQVSECYKVPDMTLRLGGGEAVIPEIDVSLGGNISNILDYECNLGLKTLMMFGKIHFNMVDFIVTTYPASISAVMSVRYKAPEFKYTKDCSPSLLQCAALVGLSVANGLFNVNAPASPDL